jgi:hypothetical protein
MKKENSDGSLSDRPRSCNPAGRSPLALSKPEMGLGRLPGDIVIERDNMTFYFPLMTCLLLSIVFSLILWVVSR